MERGKEALAGEMWEAEQGTAAAKYQCPQKARKKLCTECAGFVLGKRRGEWKWKEKKTKIVGTFEM